MIEPLFPLGVSIVVALIILGVLLFFETRRKQRFVILRMLSQVLLVSSVFALALRPQLRITNYESLLLLTDGYDQNMVDSLSELRPVTFNSYNELSKLDGVKAIAGNGLPAFALDLLPSKNYSFIPALQPKGITAIETDDHIYAHRWNNIRGTYNGESTIKLRGPGGIDDSVKVANGTFNLSFFAKVPGRFNYEMITAEGTETLPLVIEPERIFNIVFINNYPSFELRYLKNFLASKGHQLSIRNQVSKSKYKFEFDNRPSSYFQSITTALLNDTDLLIIDESSWISMSANEQRNIRNSINDGLGVIVIPETGKSKLIEFNATQDKDTARVLLDKVGTISLPALALRVSKSNPLQMAGNRVVSGYVYSGSGKIGYQLLAETYQAGLQGKAEMYSALWVPLLEKCGRKQKEDFKLRITTPFPYYENEPVSFDIVSSGKLPSIKLDNTALPITEDVFIDDLWHGTVWLEGNLWHEFAIDSTKTFVHVSKEGTWKTARVSNNIKETSRHSTQSGLNGTPVLSTSDTSVKVVLFLIFLLSAGFLWLAPKL